jgi:hypothetical protein
MTSEGEQKFKWVDGDEVTHKLPEGMERTEGNVYGEFLVYSTQAEQYIPLVCGHGGTFHLCKKCATEIQSKPVRYTSGGGGAGGAGYMSSQYYYQTAVANSNRALGALSQKIDYLNQEYQYAMQNMDIQRADYIRQQAKFLQEQFRFSQLSRTSNISGLRYGGEGGLYSSLTRQQQISEILNTLGDSIDPKTAIENLTKEK